MNMELKEILKDGFTPSCKALKDNIGELNSTIYMELLTKFNYFRDVGQLITVDNYKYFIHFLPHCLLIFLLRSILRR